MNIAPYLFDRFITSGEEVWPAFRSRDDAFYSTLGSRCLVLQWGKDDQFFEDLDLEHEHAFDLALVPRSLPPSHEIRPLAGIEHLGPSKHFIQVRHFDQGLSGLHALTHYNRDLAHDTREGCTQGQYRRRIAG